MKKKVGSELFYLDENGKRTDFVSQENILATGDVNTAMLSSEAVMRRQGFTEKEIATLLGNNKQTPEQQVKSLRLRRKSDYGDFMQECVEIMSDDGMDEDEAYQYCEMKWIEGDEDDIYYRSLQVREFDESKHPRDENGRWTDGGGADSGDGEDDLSTAKNPASKLLERNNADEPSIEEVIANLPPEFKAEEKKALDEMKGRMITQKEFMDSNGKYVSERAELHRKIIRELFTDTRIKHATPPIGTKPTLTLSGGRPAAGKTTSLKKELTEKIKTSFYINADEIQEKLPGYKGRLAGLYNAEAQDVALMAEKVARHMGLNIIYDATLKSKQPAIERVNNYIEAGYEVDGYFVHTTPATSVARSAARYLHDPDGLGRYLPPEISFNSRTNESTFDALIPKLRKWALYDNNGAHPKRIAGSL